MILFSSTKKIGVPAASIDGSAADGVKERVL